MKRGKSLALYYSRQGKKYHRYIKGGGINSSGISGKSLVQNRAKLNVHYGSLVWRVILSSISYKPTVLSG
jgi:hypothetical protein